MFTGIIEAQGQVTGMDKQKGNVLLSIASPLAGALHINQSISHNGVCLSVTQTGARSHTVTVIRETLLCSNLSALQEGDTVNLERAIPANQRLEGHIVQGHVDTTAQCQDIREVKGSRYFVLELESPHRGLLIPKGSVAVNGISLTVARLHNDQQFEIAVIPYTLAHTNLSQVKQGGQVNIEFDILGKYVAEWASQRQP